MNWEPKEPPWSRQSPGRPGADGGGSSPTTPRSPEAPGDLDAGAAGASGAKEKVSALDVEVIDVIYGVMAGDSLCTMCGRGLSQGLRIDVHDSVFPERAWVASVACRCRGWGRHRNEARVWPSHDGLHLEPFAVRG